MGNFELNFNKGSLLSKLQKKNKRQPTQTLTTKISSVAQEKYENYKLKQENLNKLRADAKKNVKPRWYGLYNDE